jgi:hypothetical protein
MRQSGVPQNLKTATLARIGMVLREVNPQEYNRVCGLPFAERRAEALKVLARAPQSTWVDWRN